ncbi:MAG: aminotransferase class IV [Cytophagales bacterium]
MKAAAKIPYKQNENILIYIDGKLYPREEAKISVFDSLVQGGDGVWEGLRVYNGKILNFQKHLDRMMDSAKALHFEDIPSSTSIKEAVFETLKANGMRNNTHIRLTLSRGKKVTSGMSPHWNQYGCTLIVIAEWKPPVFKEAGVELISSTIRRNTPQCLDSKIHHNNLLNNIMAKIEANLAGVDDAVMLDIDGFVAETNATNIFIVKNGIVKSPFADACLPGITRNTVLAFSGIQNLDIREARISLSELYAANEVFITGTMGEITAVKKIDGRLYQPGTITQKIKDLYKHLTENEGEAIPDFEEIKFTFETN